MPQSKKKHHPEHPPVPQHIKDMKRYRVIAVVVIIFLLFGTGITFFAAGFDIKWLTAGGVIGAICGYFFGNQIFKGLSKK